MSTYRDIDLSFKPHPITGDISIKKDAEAVIQSIKNLIRTTAGEILWEPNMGGGISSLLFDPNDVMTRMQLYDKITTTINMYESERVEIAELLITTFENGNGINITFTFYILNSTNPITVTVPIQRIR